MKLGNISALDQEPIGAGLAPENWLGVEIW
jgi:hypothetical protein